MKMVKGVSQNSLVFCVAFMDFISLLQTIAGGGRKAQKYFRREKYKGTVEQGQTVRRSEVIDKYKKKRAKNEKIQTDKKN